MQMEGLTTCPHRRFAALAAALLAALALAGLLALPERAAASKAQLSGIMDDDLFLYRDDATRQGALFFSKTVGVDFVRATVLWSVVAPANRRSGFVAADSGSYDPGVLDRYDRLVREAASQGIQVLLNVTYPGPTWAHARGGGRLQRVWRPDPAQFAKFVEMIGRRYSGRHRDENEGREVLPKVRLWSIGNEPNQPGWLAPQWGRARGVRGPVPLSPHIYRELYYAGERALLKAGHGGSTILLGELSPLGAGEKVNSSVRPAEFLREMFCLDRRLKPYRGRAASARGCRRLRLRPRGVAFHPYTKDVNPQRKPSHRDHITMANLAELPQLLDRIAHRTKLIRRGLKVWLTEFGFESNPPDTRNGIPAWQQAEWINVGDWLAYRQPRIAANTQFLIRDGAPRTQFPRDSREYWFNYQTGLVGHEGDLKPAYFAYKLPIHVRRASGGRLAVWGQLRFRPKNGEPDFATIEHRREGENWRPLETFSFRDRMRFLNRTIAHPGKGFLRLAYYDSAGRFEASSREAPL